MTSLTLHGIDTMGWLAEPVWRREVNIVLAGWVNGWRLFAGISAAITAFMLLRLRSADFSSPQDISAMIQCSVRWAVPFIYIVIAASALFKLSPNNLTLWLLKNRRYLGLCFAVAMAWQAAFIFIVSFSHSAHYYGEIYLLRDELEGSSGYLFLAAMTVTSFGAVRRLVTPEQWRFVHLSGVVFLWAYPFSVYWWNAFYYQTQNWFDWLFYLLGFTAFALRILAWGKERGERARAGVRCYLAASVVLLALFLASSGHVWQPALSAALLMPGWSAELELWLPFWPFEPFVPLLVFALGVAFASGRSAASQPHQQTALKL